MALDLRGIKAATFNTPTNYVESVRYYEQNLQDKINETYQYASNTYEIGQELVRGTLDFTPLVCRVCHAINPKTGLNLGDDFKDLKFFDVFSHRTMGERYWFNNSVWITTNTDNYHYNTQSAIIRRCNNTLNLINSNGCIIREPCIVGYSIKYANIYYNTSVEIPQGTIVVTAQNNDITQGININDRFILDNQAFKIKSVKDYLRSNTTIGESVPLIEFEMYVDAISPDDDFELCIANMSRYKGIYKPYEEVKPSDKATSLVGEAIVGTSVVGESETNIGAIVIEPYPVKLYQGEQQTYTCSAYGYVTSCGCRDSYDYEEPIDVEFVFSTSGANPNRYKFEVIDGNTFSVMCLGKSTVPLVVTCSGGGVSKQVTIDLRGLY